jgi:ribosomal protein L13
VVAVGCSNLHTTGKKMEKKKYYSHSMRPGRLQEITMERMIAKYGGAEVLRRAVSGMLPKNRLRDVRLARLKGRFFVYGREDGSVLTEDCQQLSRAPVIHTRRTS